MDENEAKKLAYIICYVQTAIDRVLLYYLCYGQKFAARSCNNWSLGVLSIGVLSSCGGGGSKFNKY